MMEETRIETMQIKKIKENSKDVKMVEQYFRGI